MISVSRFPFPEKARIVGKSLGAEFLISGEIHRSSRARKKALRMTKEQQVSDSQVSFTN
jgi:hypothetical protein